MVNLETLKTDMLSMSDAELNDLMREVRKTRSTPKVKEKAVRAKRAAKPIDLDALSELTDGEKQRLIKKLTGGMDAN